MVNKLYYILTCVLIVISQSLFATVRTDFKVNDDRSTALQTSPRIAVAVDQTFAITWVDRREGTSDIYLQKYDNAGFPIGVNVKINDDTNSTYQFEPAIAVELSGRYSLVWKDYRTGTFPLNPEIFTQRYDSTFTKIGVNEQLTTESPAVFKETPDISLSDTKEGVVVWADYRNSNWDIYGQLISSDGSHNGTNFLVNDDIVNAQQHKPRVSISNEGWFVVTWYENRFGDDDVFAQVFDSLGVPLDTNILINQDVDGARQAFPDVTTDGAGNFTVVWVDWRNGVYPANPDIYSRKYTSAMVPITDEVTINSDGAATAQREPAISADRLGNVAIIWADSNNRSWDIVGQMIDVDGVVRDTNFIANSDKDSAQVSPDVAIDGKQRYVTWVDRRNGNYDIYASIQEYNDPNLAVSENVIQFNMQEGTSVPSAQTIIVEHLGYNPLDFTISSNMSWLDVTPSTSTTTDTVSLTVNTDTLPIGLYTGVLTFRDHTYNDSSLSVGVRLSVYMPTMELSSDTISVTMFEGIDDTILTQVVIQNSSNGTFSWAASESISWLTPSSYAGFDSDTVQMSIEASGLTPGSYSDIVIFSSADANGSPDTLVVQLEVINNLPYIKPTPDSIFIYTDSITNYTLPIVVTNFGTDTLHWTSTSIGSWFTIDTTSGTDGDTVTIIIDSTIAFGRYMGSVQIDDASSFNKTVTVPLILDYYQISADTLRFSSTSSATIQTASISLTLEAEHRLKGIRLPFQFDTTYVQLDSIVEGVTLPDMRSLSYSVNNNNGTAMLYILANTDTSLNTGSSHLAELYFTTKSVLGISTIDSIITDSITAFVIDTASQRYAPQVDTGFIDVDVATGINNENPFTIPDRMELYQNYPNPFNLSTSIAYTLPTRAEVALNIYNILGQKVRVLINSVQPAGRHEVLWNGKYDDGRVSPSGIYFYRLEISTDILVKKMVLLK